MLWLLCQLQLGGHGTVNYCTYSTQDGGVSRFEDIFKKSWEQNEIPEEINEEDEGLTLTFLFCYERICSLQPNLLVS
jgi:hypothetical protein